MAECRGDNQNPFMGNSLRISARGFVMPWGIRDGSGGHIALDGCRIIAREATGSVKSAMSPFHSTAMQVRMGGGVMTWWTEAGHITMPKPVIDLMAEAAMSLRDEIVSEIVYEDPELHPHVGVPVFDSLDPRTQVFTLAYVLRHLAEPDLSSPDLYAWNEGTVWAIFVKAGDDLEVELEFEESLDVEDDLKFRYRHLIRDALEAVEPSARRPPLRSRKLSRWKDCLDAIADHLIWDHDFLDDAKFADLDPFGSKLLKKLSGIADDYFSTPPPLVREEDYREADRYLRRAAGCPELMDPWDPGFLR